MTYINKLDLLPGYQDLAKRIDGAGVPDDQLSTSEIDGYRRDHSDNPDVPSEFLWYTVKKGEQQRASVLAMTPERAQQIARERAELIAAGDNFATEAHPVTIYPLKGRRESGWTEGELYALYGVRATPLMKSAAADGVVTEDERKAIDASTQDPAEARLRQITTDSLAIRQRGLIGNLARDNLLGIAPDRVGLEPPKVDYKVAMQDFTRRARAEGVRIVLDSRYGSKKLDAYLPESLKGFPNHSLFGNEQFDPNAIADKILAVWDTPNGPTTISGQRILHALLTTDNEHISDAFKEDIADAVMAKMTPEHGKTLRPTTIAALNATHCDHDHWKTREAYLRQVGYRASPDEADAAAAGYSWERVVVGNGQTIPGPRIVQQSISRRVDRKLRPLTKDHLDWGTGADDAITELR